MGKELERRDFDLLLLLTSDSGDGDAHESHGGNHDGGDVRENDAPGGFHHFRQLRFLSPEREPNPEFYNSPPERMEHSDS